MRKLISFLMVVLIALPLYSYEPEYNCVGKQFNTVVVNAPSVITIEKSKEHSVSITNISPEVYDYKFVNDTLVIKPKYQFNFMKMEPDLLKVKLKHPHPGRLSNNIVINNRGLFFREKSKSGNQN